MICAAARRDGYASETAEQAKRCRYAPTVLPAVLETGGRLGTTLRQWLRRTVQLHRDDEERTQLVTAIYRLLGTTLQREVSSQVLSAAGLRRWLSIRDNRVAGHL